MAYDGHGADRLPHAHVIVFGAQSGHIADDLRLQRRDPPLMNLILAAGSVPTHGSGVSTGNVLEGFIVAGLLAHLLLQLRPSRRAVWNSRWEAVAPLLSVMGRDLIAVVTLPMTYIDMRRKAKRDLQTFHSDRDVYIPDEWERDVGR